MGRSKRDGDGVFTAAAGHRHTRHPVFTVPQVFMPSENGVFLARLQIIIEKYPITTDF
ncbi:MAG: hypothetical protein J6S82_11350 [Bacteroidales bacterium]|nr:hypothetical protein [Bacteroidales bacterium]